MCGRYSIAVNPEQLQNQFGVTVDLPDGGLPVNYNVAPTQDGLVLTDRQTDRFSLFRWGLVPPWAKDLKIGARMINARSEGIEIKPSFRKPIRERRCLVIADSFYEWKRRGREKIPFRILPADGSLLVMAGIWEKWHNPETAEITQSFAIITGAPNAEMKVLHDRMPMLLQSELQQAIWLDGNADLGEVLDLLHTPLNGVLKTYQVGPGVGNYHNNGPGLHVPVTSN